VVVDYVNADGIYMAVGADEGAAEGDTVTAWTAPDGGTSVRLHFTTVTRRRSVALPLNEPWPATGDTLWLSLRPTTNTAAAEPEPDRGGPALPIPQPRAPGAAAGRGTARRPSLSGRLSLDVHGRESTTRWGGDLAGSVTRRYAIPTTRLSMVASDLPGGFELRVGARAAYRYTQDFAGPATTSLRVYEMAATRDFERVPLRVTLGRFSNPYERYSGFWDGMLLRIGRRTGLGAGVVAGFDPRRANEAIATDVPKLTAFVDFSARGRSWRYETDVSAHLIRPSAGEPTRSLGWTQRLRAGPLSLAQRLLVDAGTDGADPVLRQLRAQLGLDLADGVRLRGSYSHRAPDRFPGLDSLSVPILLAPTLGARDEVTVGLGVHGPAGDVWLDAGRSELEGSEPGNTLSVRSSLRIGDGRLYGSGRILRGGAATSVSASPGIGFTAFGADVRAAYRLYRTSGTASELTTHAADVTLRLTMARGLGMSLGGGRQWGATLSGTSVRLGLWRSF
jgi:hypothetical protein